MRCVQTLFEPTSHDDSVLTLLIAANEEEVVCTSLESSPASPTNDLPVLSDMSTPPEELSTCYGQIVNSTIRNNPFEMYDGNVPTYVPTRASSSSVGFDIFMPSIDSINLYVGVPVKIRTNLRLNQGNLPAYHFVQLKEKSGNNCFFILGGVIDPDYTGEIFVKVYPYENCTLNFGDALCQALVLKYSDCDVASLNNIRGNFGFGELTSMSMKILYQD